MCDTCNAHGPLSPETVVCGARPDQIARLLRDIMKLGPSGAGACE